MRSACLVLFAVGISSLFAACGDSELTCDEGEVAEDGACVPSSGVTTSTGSGAGAGSGSGANGAGGSGADGGGGAGGVIDPGYPPFPEVIGTLSIAILTGSGTNDGTDANALSVCLSETDCFPLNVLDVDDFRVGEFDVYHFEDVGLPRANVDRVEIRSVNGTDAWRPACIEIRMDGEPVHCEDQLDALLGNGNATGEAPTWTDPSGLHESCVTCYPTTVTHGPIVGATDDSSARVAFRTDATRKVAVRLAPTGASDAPIVAYSYPLPTDDFMGEVALSGLAPATSYEVSFEVEGELSPKKATFTTASPAGSAAPLRLAFGSCARVFDQPIFDEILAFEPDAFLFVGDNHYANSADRDSLRWYYRRSAEVPERAALLASTPSLAIWDDHDFVGNNTIGSSPGKEVALRAFGEYWANPSLGTPSTPGVFFTHKIGDVELFMTDGRYYRSAESNSNGSILGAEQTEWLKTALTASTATFKVIASGSMWSFTGDETWEDFPAARAEVFDFIRDEGITGVVLLAGDVHRSLIRKIDRTAAGAYDLPEIVSSPLANTNSTCAASPPAGVTELGCFDDDDFFATLDFDTAAADPTLTAKIIDATGATRATLVVSRSELE